MLRLSWIPLALLLIALARPCAAQERPFDDEPTNTQAPTLTFSRTPEMWLYEQERIRYDDPKQAVRRRAELRAAHRSDRLAALKWYGMSNSRPIVNTTPSMGGSYSPYWGSNTYDPYRWRAYSPTVVLRPYDARY